MINCILIGLINIRFALNIKFKFENKTKFVDNISLANGSNCCSTLAVEMLLRVCE